MTGKQDQPTQPNDQQAQNQTAQPATQPSQSKGIEPVDTPAPRYHASDSVTWFQQRQQQQVKDRADPGIPDAARPVSLTDAKYVALPPGGIAALADALYPGDKSNAEAMHDHVFNLMVANRDVVRTDTDSSAGAVVRIP